ncbi:hypothetical protein I4U23_001770 [Adineta vaga]|nr:hypothetical protein I4U23_001770 [Adineta vaga]
MKKRFFPILDIVSFRLILTMASAYDLSHEILRVFVNMQRNEMSLTELHQNLASPKNRLTIDEVLRTIRSTNLSNLFNLQSISNELCFIQLSPKLTLCEACLKKNCRTMRCSKLHLCCYPSHFFTKTSDKNCCFPHKLSEHPNNIILLRKFNYDTFNEDLLLDILRLHHKISNEQSPSERHSYPKRPISTIADYPPSNHIQSKTPIPGVVKSRPPSHLKKSPIQSTVITENVAERQLDISIPSERDAPDVDLEIVQLVLATKDIMIERTLEKQISNDFYRKYTLQFKSKQIIDDVLKSEPIIAYNNVPIKMKRTIRQKDTRIFALKFDTDKKIDNMRLNLYVETLVGKQSSTIIDMTPDGNDQQIYLIRCEQPIDFEHVYRIHAAKNTLQASRVIITEIYEAETLEVSFTPNSLHPPMTIQRLRQLFGEIRWQQDVFACINIHDQNSADIELMNAEITARWLSDANRIERDLSLIIRPIIDFIQSSEKNDDEDDEEITKLMTKSKSSTSFSPSNISNESPKGDNESNVYHIKQDWRIILTHPIFGEEYRKYIREKMNLSVQITGSSIQLPNEYIRKELARYTNMFIQNFLFHEVNNPDKAQVKLIKENYHRMAHKWQRDTTKTLVAARREVMNELFPRPGSATRPSSKSIITPTFRSRLPLNLKKQAQPPSSTQPTEEILTSQSSIKTIEESINTLPYSIENSVYFPFFRTTNAFPDRLKTYLLNTFHINLEIKFISSTKLMLELKGQQNNIYDARTVLQSLFTSLKTKAYSNTSESSKFTIPDLYQVAQWNLDRCSVISSCSYSPKNGGTLLVRYFADNPQFGTDEQTIDDIIFQNLYDIVYQLSAMSRKLDMKLNELQKIIHNRSDYGQQLCCWFNSRKESTEKNRLHSIYLGGTKAIVDEIIQEIKKIAEEYTPVLCNIQLISNQVIYLLQLCSAELIKFEKEYEADGVDLRSRLKCVNTSQFLAPKYLHEKIKLYLIEMSQIQMVSKDFKCSLHLLDEKKNEIKALAAKNHCLISIASPLLPKAAPLPSRATHSTSKISSGAINISNGDLTTEKSDILVICSTSTKLRDAIIKAAGTEVEKELSGKNLKTMIDTSAGQLKQAKRLLFIPWTPPTSLSSNEDLDSIRHSISAFIQQAFKFTIQGNFKSIAFPAVGCGGFRIPAEVIASIMIDTTQEQLASNSNVQLTITFVIQQPNVYDIFSEKLKPTSISSATAASRTRPPSPSRLLNPEKINITLTTSNANIDKAKKLLEIIETVLI